MTDSSSRKAITATQHDDYISIKVISSWGNLAILEDHLEEELQMEITAFKPIKDGDGKEIGSELLYPNVHPVEDVQVTMDMDSRKTIALNLRIHSTLAWFQGISGIAAQ